MNDNDGTRKRGYDMRNICLTTLLMAATIFVMSPLTANASGAAELESTFKAINRAGLDVGSTIEVKNLVLEHHDLVLTLDSGRMAFLTPVTIGSETKVIGAYWEGFGRFQFVPPNDMERGQLWRFFEAESLNHPLESMLFYFSDDLHKKLAASGQKTDSLFSDDQIDAVKEHREEFQKNIRRPYMFGLLNALITPSEKPFMLINANLEKIGRVFYEYDPHQRESVKLYKHYRRPGRNYMELAGSYWPNPDNNPYANINGPSMDRIRVDHYDTDVTVDGAGEFTGICRMDCEVVLEPTQLLQMDIHPRLHIDSIVDPSGNHLPWTRYDKVFGVHTYESNETGIFLDRPYTAGEKLQFKFYLSGNIKERKIAAYLVDAGDNWYPRYGFNQRATFDMKFRTPEKYAFVASGQKVKSGPENESLLSEWKVATPVANVTFNIGDMKEYQLEGSDVCPIDVYYLEAVHRDTVQMLADQVAGAEAVMSTTAGEGAIRVGDNVADRERTDLVMVGRNMEKQVADDAVNAMRLFQHYYGPCAVERMRVGEILPRHGGAFPGQMSLCIDSWIKPDKWGVERVFRAHEIAHQWWGVEVGHETYHDRWLCEGLCEYSALMYLQAAEGNDKFLDRVREYRDDIYTIRGFMAASGEEFGPIALGDRTESVTRVQDFEADKADEQETSRTSSRDQTATRTQTGPNTDYEDFQTLHPTEFSPDMSQARLKNVKRDAKFNLAIDKKAALVFHMLRNMLIDFTTMNEDAFFNMMREFYQSNRGRNVNTADFQVLVEKYVGYEMDWFFEQWLYRDELPTYEFSYEILPDEEGGFKAVCHIKTEGVPEDFMAVIPLEIEIDSKRKAYIRTYVDQLDYEFTLPGLPEKPKRLRLNPFESVLAKVKQ